MKIYKATEAIGAVTLTVNIPPVAGKLPKFNTVKILISPPYPGGRGFNWLVHKGNHFTQFIVWIISPFISLYSLYYCLLQNQNTIPS
jgi:hypothetical protein